MAADGAWRIAVAVPPVSRPPTTPCVRTSRFATSNIGSGALSLSRESTCCCTLMRSAGTMTAHCASPAHTPPAHAEARRTSSVSEAEVRRFSRSAQRRATSPCTAKPIALRGPVARSGGAKPRRKPASPSVAWSCRATARGEPSAAPDWIRTRIVSNGCPASEAVQPESQPHTKSADIEPALSLSLLPLPRPPRPPWRDALYRLSPSFLLGVLATPTWPIPSTL
eukprot:scaffold64703_cov32-Tisochrysis_lutea.AAC.1